MIATAPGAEGAVVPRASGDVVRESIVEVGTGGRFSEMARVVLPDPCVILFATAAWA